MKGLSEKTQTLHYKLCLKNYFNVKFSSSIIVFHKINCNFALILGKLIQI